MGSTTVVEQGMMIVGVSTSSLVVGGVVALVAIANPVGAMLSLFGACAIGWSLSKKK